MTMETVSASLACVKDVYGQLTPFERRELMRLLLRRAEVSDRQIVLEIYPVTAPKMAAPHVCGNMPDGAGWGRARYNWCGRSLMG